MVETLVAALATYIGTTAATLVVTSAISAIATTTLSYAVRALTQPGAPTPPRPGSFGIDALRQVTRSNISPRRIVYGTTRVSGVLAYAATVDENGKRKDEGKVLHVCLLICEGPIESIENIWLGDTASTSTRYTDTVLFVVKTGEPDQEPLSAPVTVGPETVKLPAEWIDGAHALRGVAYIWGVLRFDQVAFPQGPPVIRATVKGRRIYDPRDTLQTADDPGTWTYSTNPALCIYDYMTNRTYGMQISADRINLDSVIAAANICDETVTVPIDGKDPSTGTAYKSVTQKRYTCNGIFETNGKRGDVLDALFSSMAGHPEFKGGQYHLMAGADRLSTFHLTIDDLAGPLECQPAPGRTDRINTVQGTYVNPDLNWEPDSFATQTSPAFIEADGGEVYAQEIDLPFTQDKYEAQRLARITLLRGRRAEAFRWPGKLTCMSIEAGDVGTITVPYLGLTDKKVICETWGIGADGAVDLTLRAYNSGPRISTQGLVLRIEADQITDLNDGIAITSFTESAGGKTVNVFGAPTLQTDEATGHRCFRLDGNDDYLTVSGVTLPTRFALYVVGKFSKTNPMFIEHGQESVTTNGAYFYGTSGATLKVRRGASANEFSASSNWMGEDRCLVVAHWGNGAQHVAKNGVTLATNSNTSVPNTNTTDTLWIGSRGGASLFTKGDFEAIYLYDLDQTADEERDIVAAIAIERGITVTPAAPTIADGGEYTFDLAELRDPPPSTTLPDGFAIAPPSGVLVSERVVTNPDGSRGSVLVITILPPTETVIVDHYRIQYRHEDDSTSALQTRLSQSTTVEIPGLRIGAYAITVETVNRVGVFSSKFYAAGSVSFAADPPPDIKHFNVQLFADGMRRFSWLLSAEAPIDLAGYRLKYALGALGSDPNAEWATARALADGIVPGSPFNVSNRLTRPGSSYTVYIKAVDTADNESVNAAFLTFTVPQPSQATGILAEVDAGEHDWPGQVVGGQRCARGVLEAVGTTTWDDLPATWDDWTQWTIDPGTLTYLMVGEDGQIDLGRNVSVEPTAFVTALGDYEVRMRSKVDPGTAAEGTDVGFSPWVPLRPVTARFFEFQVRVLADTAPVPTLMQLGVRLQRYQQEEAINDISLASQARSQLIERREETAWQWQQGIHRNTFVRSTGGGMAQVECDNDSALRFVGGSQYLRVPDAAQIQLTRSFTIEAMVRVDGLTQSNAALFTKGGKWGIRYHNGAFNLEATGYSGDNPTTTTMAITDAFCGVHVAFTYDGGVLRGYLDGVVQFEKALNFTLATSTDDLYLCNDAAASRPWAGIIEEVRVWGIARSVDQIRSTIDRTVDPSEVGLALYLRCNDATGTTVADSSPYKNHGIIGRATGAYPSWMRWATRVAPHVDLGVVRLLEALKVVWSVTLPASTGITVQVSPDYATWTTISSNQALTLLIAQFAAGSDMLGKRLYVRVFLESTDVSVTPALTSMLSQMLNKPAQGGELGDFTVVPSTQFSVLDSAQITAIQNTLAPLTWSLVVRQPYGVRFKLNNTNSGPITNSVTVDVLLRGGAVPA